MAYRYRHLDKAAANMCGLCRLTFDVMGSWREPQAPLVAGGWAAWGMRGFNDAVKSVAEGNLA